MLGLPSSTPDDIVITPFSNRSFAVKWAISYPEYSYIVTWTNLYTGVMDSSVPRNTNSYIVTGLSDDVNYNMTIITVGVCGMKTNDPITVYGEYTSSFPNQVYKLHTFM